MMQYFMLVSLLLVVLSTCDMVVAPWPWKGAGTVDSTNNLYQVCNVQTEMPRNVDFEPWKGYQQSTRCTSFTDDFYTGISVEALVPMHLFICSTSTVGLSPSGGHPELINAYGLTPLPNDTSMIVPNGNGNTEEIYSWCEHPPIYAYGLDQKPTAINNAWTLPLNRDASGRNGGPATPIPSSRTYCCILKYTPSCDYNNTLYIHNADYNSYSRLIKRNNTSTNSCDSTKPPTTIAPTTPAPTTKPPTPAPTSTIWVKYSKADSYSGSDVLTSSGTSNPTASQQLASTSGYVGFVTCSDGMTYFRRQTAIELLAGKTINAACDLWVKQDATTRYWIRYLGYDSFGGQDVKTLTSTTPALAQPIAQSNNYVGFVMWNKNAYFRSQDVTTLVNNKKKCDSCELWVYAAASTMGTIASVDVPDSSSSQSCPSILMMIGVAVGVGLGAHDYFGWM